MSEPEAEQLDAIVARAREDAEVFLRQEWRGRQRECLFGAGGVFLIGVLLLVCVGPVFELATTHLGVGVLATTAIAMTWCALRWRCPRCEKIPWTGATLLAHRVFSPKGCPHCNLRFGTPPTRALKP